jgi:NAD(P)H-dependent FMN reductase
MGAFSIPVIVGSTRRGRQTPKVARFIQRRLERDEIESDLLDLAEYDFPIMEERLRQRDDPPRGLTEFSERIASADALVIVTPEYNSGYPGVLKNALDYLLPEYRRKPVGIISVSAGVGGPVGRPERFGAAPPGHPLVGRPPDPREVPGETGPIQFQ